MTTLNIPDTIANLTAQQTALGDGRDKRSEVEKADYAATYKAHAETISALMNLPADLAKLETRLAAINADRTAAIAKRTELEKQLADAPDWQTIRDGRARDAEQERQRQLRLSLELLANGTLLRAPGVAYRPLVYLDSRIKELTEQRDRAQRALDGFIAAAQALLTEQAVTS